MAINFPDPSASPWYNDPASGGNGVTYVYTSGGYWTAVQVTGSNAIDQTTGDARYVNVSGDNMTGNLTLDTNKITLNTNGSATFKSTVDVTSATYTYIGRRSSDNTATFAATDAGYVNIGPVSGNNSNIILDGSNGNATFTGNANFTGNVNVGTVASAAYLQFPAATGWGPRIQQGGASINDLAVFTNNAEALTVKSSGNVGIGTTSPMTDAALTLGASSEVGLGFSRTGTGKFDAGMLVTSGHIVFKGGVDSTSLASLNELMRIDSSGRVGVGVTNPQHALVVGNGTDDALNVDTQAAGGGVVLRSYDDGTTDYEPFGIAAEYVNFYTRTGVNSSAERMRIDSNGHLLLGTTTPGDTNANELTIGSAGHTGITIRAAETSSSSIYFADGTGGTNVYTGAIIYNHSSDHMSLHTNAGAERMRIDSSGRLLVGKTATGTNNARLQSASATGPQIVAQNTGSGSAYALFVNSTTGDAASGDGLFVGLDAGIGYVWNYENNALLFGTNSTSRMRLTSGGSLQITANSNVDNIYSGVASSGTSATVFRGSHSASVGSPGSGTDSIYIFANGNIQNTNNSYGQISDIKLKENIVDAPSQWNDFKAVRFRKYNFKAETGHETHTQLGVIAQELELTCPGLVYETVDKDKDGNDLGTTTKAVKSSILTIKALVALQEAMTRIETLETKVAQLESN